MFEELGAANTDQSTCTYTESRAAAVTLAAGSAGDAAGSLVCRNQLSKSMPVASRVQAASWFCDGQTQPTAAADARHAGGRKRSHLPRAW